MIKATFIKKQKKRMEEGDLTLITFQIPINNEKINEIKT